MFHVQQSKENIDFSYEFNTRGDLTKFSLSLNLAVFQETKFLVPLKCQFIKLCVSSICYRILLVNVAHLSPFFRIALNKGHSTYI